METAENIRKLQQNEIMRFSQFFCIKDESYDIIYFSISIQ
jgi:hypothetical protein